MSAYQDPEWDPFRKARIGALCVLVVLVLAIVFFVIRGVLAPSSPPQPRQPRPSTAPTPAPSPLSGVGPGSAVGLSGWPGAARVVNGLPVGYADTQDGATAAAANYSTVLEGQLLLAPQSYRATEAAAAAPGAESMLTAEGEMRLADAEKALGGTATPGATANAVVRYVPVAYAIESYQPGQAVILVWGISIAGLDGRQTATQAWTTTRVGLVWTGGDWKLGDLSVGPGPAPQLSQPAYNSMALPPELTGFHPYRG